MEMISKLIVAYLLYISTPSLCIASFFHEIDNFELAARIEAAEATGDSDELKTRLWGGWYPKLGIYRYMAGLITMLDSDRRIVCGGVVITNSRLLTAAHCWVDESYQGVSMTVVLGSLLVYSGGTRIGTNYVILYDGYVKKKPYHNHHDIAMIVIPAVEYTETIGYAVIPYGEYLTQNFDTYSAIVTGYGKRTESDTIRNKTLAAVPLRIISDAECAKEYLQTNDCSELLPPSVICTSQSFGRGICSGDSGSPLVSFISGERILTATCVEETPAPVLTTCSSGDNGRRSQTIQDHSSRDLLSGDRLPTLIGLVRGSRSGDCQVGKPAWFARVSYYYTWIVNQV